MKDDKRDNELSKGISTGTFFGGRALIRGAAQIAGIPRPIARIIASLGATAFAESAKVAARSTLEKRDIDNNDNNDNIINDSKKSVAIKTKSTFPNMRQKIQKNVYDSKKPKTNSIKSNEATKSKKPLITASEVTGDVSKWVIYDLLPFKRNENAALPELLGESAEVGNHIIIL